MSFESGAPSKPEHPRPWREEIEYLCLVYAVGLDGCLAPQLAERLGLSSALAPCIEEAVVMLLCEGHIELDHDRLTVTPAGREWLQRRLAVLGIPA